MEQPATKYGKKSGIGKGRPPAATRFKIGNGGRPKGSRNRSSVFAEALTDDDATKIIRAVIGKAKTGDMVAARLVMDRLWPSPKSRAVTFEMPSATDVKAIMQAHGALVQSVAVGVLTPDEGEAISRVLAAHLRVIEAEDLERRVQLLEDRPNSGAAE